MADPINSENSLSCQDWLQQAQSWRDQQNNEDALTCYQQALQIDPQNLAVLESLGDFYSEQQQWTKAIATYKQIIQLTENTPDSAYTRNLAKKLAIFLQQRAAQDRQKLLLVYQQNIAQEPYNLDYYHQVIALDSQNIDLYLGLGNALCHHQQLNEAIVTYQMALQIDPHHQVAQEQLAKVNELTQEGKLNSLSSTKFIPEVSLTQAKKSLEQLSQNVLNDFLEADTKLKFPELNRPLVSIILVLFNRAELTLMCLQSLLEQPFHNFEVIIVDNNSSDRTAELLKQVEGAQIIHNPTNQHFLLGANQASHFATGTYLLFLNNDAQLLGNSLQAAVETLSSEPDIGAVGGKIILPNGALQEAGSIIWQDGSCVGYGRGDNPDAFAYQFQREVDYCSGAFLLTPRDLFKQLDCFDLSYQPAYYEETDYCVRLQRLGKKIIYDPRVSILHYEFASSTHNQEAIALQTQHQQIFCDRHQDWLANQYSASQNNLFVASDRRSHGKKILFIEDRIPHPYLGSGYTRAHCILQTMVQLGHQVSFYPTELSYQENWQAAYQDLSAKIEIIQGWGLQKLADFLQSRPDYYDLIFVSRPHNMNHLNYLQEKEQVEITAPIIYDAEALYCLREFAYQELQGQELSPIEKEQAIAQELKLAKISSKIVAVSAAEQTQFRQYGYQQVEVLGHSLTLQPTPKNFQQRQNMLFVGSIYDLKSPNADSLLWFTQEIFPLIQAELDQEICLLIAGNNQVTELTSRIEQLHNPQIKLLGKVDNLFDLYNNSRLFIAPTRYSAGIPHKVHEASSYGLPVVTTSAIAEQLNWQAGTDLLTANEAKIFAQQCSRLYQESELWQKLRKNSLQKIKEQCSPQSFQEKLTKILE